MSKVYQYYLDLEETEEDSEEITDEIFFEWVADQHEKFHKMEDLDV